MNILGTRTSKIFAIVRISIALMLIALACIFFVRNEDGSDIYFGIFLTFVGLVILFKGWMILIKIINFFIS